MNSILQRINNVEKHYCCCCGNELTTTDTDYYDLSDYCYRCAVADGIIEEDE